MSLAGFVHGLRIVDVHADRHSRDGLTMSATVVLERWHGFSIFF